jgi:uncharacterized hydrophobic protein (TIGR00271 family)
MQRSWQLFKNLGLGAIPILKLRESLWQDTQLTQNYLILILSSCLIATFGLMINSTAVIIGAMIIAPLMLPLRGFSFATLEGDLELLRSSFIAISVGTFISIGCSWLIGLIIGILEFGAEILARTQPTLIDLLIAVVAGGISGYAKIRPAIGDALPGTAIAVALMPPLCVIGLTLAGSNWEAAGGATLLYLTNLIGINLACIAVYVLAGYAKSNEVTRNLSWGVSLVLIAILAIPLGISFWQLTNQARIDRSLKKILVTDSLINRQDIEVLHLKVNWRRKTPSILLNVRAVKPLTAEEVKLVEELLQKEFKRPFVVIFDVTPLERVQS